MLEKRNEDGTFASVNLTELGKLETVTNGRSYKYMISNLEQDGIYTLKSTATDRAGNTTEEMLLNGTEQTASNMVFSVNRHGSTFGVSEETRQLIGNFAKQPIDVVIYEVNPDRLKNIELSIFKDDKTVTLQDGVDCDIDCDGGDDSWYFYTYTLFAKNFEDDGVYQVSTYSEDAAGNIASNTLDVKGVNISFAVDRTAPTLIVTNLESNETYPEDSRLVRLQVADNMQLDTLRVVLDGREVAFWDKQALIEKANELSFTVPGDVLTAHTVNIVLTDTAGNETVKDITKFYVTTNLWLRLIRNKALLIGICVSGIVIFTCVGFFIVAITKRRREQN